MATKKVKTEEVEVKEEVAEVAPIEEVAAEAPVTEAEEAPKKKSRRKTKEEKEEAKKAKKAEEEKPAKVMPTEAVAHAKSVRVTPRKVRLVIDLVRGKDVKEALGILANTNKAASEPVTKLIKSAAANATNNFGMDADRLYIATIYANDGIRMKRYIPRAKGSASGLVKRTSHITVVLKQR